MKRVWGHLLAGLSLLAGAATAVPACAHNDSSLFVQNVLAQQLVTNGAQCFYTNDPTQPFISSGVLDVSFRNQYDAEFLIANQLVPESNGQQLQTETSTITVQGAVVRITDAGGNQLNSFTRYTSATVYPAAGTVPGYSPVGVTILDSTTVNSAAASLPANGSTRLVTYTTFFGHTLGGKYVESDEFEFPVDLCNACLITFSAADINPLCGTPNCLGGGSGSSTANLPAPCIQGQDDAVDCALCQQNAACNPNTTCIGDAGGGG